MRVAPLLVLGAMAVFTLSQMPASRVRAASEAIGRSIANLEVQGWRWFNDDPPRRAELDRLAAEIGRGLAAAQSWVFGAVGGFSGHLHTIAGVQMQIDGAAADKQAIVRLAGGISIPQIQRTLGMTFHGPIAVSLLQDKSAYDKALMSLGATGSQAGVMVDRTSGVEAGDSVYLPLFNDGGKYMLANVLTHELTHVLFYQNNLSNTLPTWLNEGTAWYEGLTAERSLSRLSADHQLEVGLQGVGVASSSGTALSLQATEAQLLRAPYDVEIQDYEAVSLLVALHGVKHYAAFLREVRRTSVPTAFRRAYGMSLSAFVGRFADYLRAVTFSMENAPMSARALSPFISAFLPQMRGTAASGRMDSFSRPHAAI